MLNNDEKGAIYGLPTISFIGIALLVIGFVGPAALATVHIDTTTPSYSGYWPDTGSDSPVSVAPGATKSVKLVVDEDLSGGVSKAKVDKKNDGSYDTTIDLTYADDYRGYWSYDKDWTFPSTAQKIKFTFVAEDSAGNKNTKDGYAKIGSPAGDLYINGNKVGEDSNITLATDDLNFKIKVTNQADMVDSASVQIVDVSSIDLNETSTGVWEGSYSNLDDGTYTIKGWLYDGSGNNWRIASILAGVGEEPNPGETDDGLTKWNWVSVIGGAMIPIGFFFKV